MLIPRSLTIDGVVFPLVVHDWHVHVDEREMALNALDILVSGMILAASGPARSECLRARDAFSRQARSATPVTAETPVSELHEGPIHWMRLSGAWPDCSDAYAIYVAGTLPMLVLPAPTLIALVDQIGALWDDVKAGRREPRIDPTEPMPPRPPPTPEVLEYDRLHARGFETDALAVIAKHLPRSQPRRD